MSEPAKTFQASVAYPLRPSLPFNMTYYLTHHMPLVSRLWTPLGLLSYQVLEYNVPEDSETPAPAYSVICILKWKDRESFDKATTGDTAKEVFGDVPKFTGIEPVVLPGVTYH